MIAGVHSELDHVKGDVERTVRALTTDAAVRILRRAFEGAGVLPSAMDMLDSGANSLGDAVAVEPVESFESIRFRGAFEVALEMLEQEYVRRRRHASVLLGLCVLGVFVTAALVTLALVTPAFVASGSFWHGMATRINLFAVLVLGLGLSGAICFWYRYASRLAERVREDLRTLAKVELRRP